MEHVRSENLGSSTNHHIEPTSYTEYMNWYNEEELVETPLEEQHPHRTLTVQKMGVKAYEAARLASCIETQEEAPGMSLEELIQEFERVRIIKERVEKNLREAEEREKAYARNRRTSPFLGAIITNAAIA